MIADHDEDGVVQQVQRLQLLEVHAYFVVQHPDAAVVERCDGGTVFGFAVEDRGGSLVDKVNLALDRSRPRVADGSSCLLAFELAQESASMDDHLAPDDLQPLSGPFAHAVPRRQKQSIVRWGRVVWQMGVIRRAPDEEAPLAVRLHERKGFLDGIRLGTVAEVIVQPIILSGDLIAGMFDDVERDFLVLPGVRGVRPRIGEPMGQRVKAGKGGNEAGHGVGRVRDGRPKEDTLASEAIHDRAGLHGVAVAVQSVGPERVADYNKDVGSPCLCSHRALCHL